MPFCKASDQNETLLLPQGAPFSCPGYGKVPLILEYIADQII